MGGIGYFQEKDSKFPSLFALGFAPSSNFFVLSLNSAKKKKIFFQIFQHGEQKKNSTTVVPPPTEENSNTEKILLKILVAIEDVKKQMDSRFDSLESRMKLLESFQK